MINRTVFLIALCLFFACACTDRTASGGVEAGESESEDKPKSGYAQSIDKARQVEDQVLKAAEKQKREIEEQAGGG